MAKFLPIFHPNPSSLGFSKDFDMLNSGHKHAAIHGLHDNMAAVGVLGTVPWLMSMLSKIPGATGSYSKFTDWCGRELQAKRDASRGPFSFYN
jgi:hypothetical protein